MKNLKLVVKFSSLVLAGGFLASCSSQQLEAVGNLAELGTGVLSDEPVITVQKETTNRSFIGNDVNGLCTRRKKLK